MLVYIEFCVVPRGSVPKDIKVVFYVGSNQGGRKLRWGSVVNKTFRALRLVLCFGLTNNTRCKTTNLGKRIVTELALMRVLYFAVFTDEYFGNTDTSHLIYA